MTKKLNLVVNLISQFYIKGFVYVITELKCVNKILLIDNLKVGVFFIAT